MRVAQNYEQEALIHKEGKASGNVNSASNKSSSDWWWNWGEGEENQGSGKWCPLNKIVTLFLTHLKDSRHAAV